MAQRSVWVPWDQQPQEYAPVDPDHPLGRALDAAWIGNDLGGVDVLKSHKVSLLSGVTIANTTRGKAFAHTGTSGSVVAIPGEASLPYVQVGYGYFNTAGGAWILSSLNTAAGGYTSRLALASSTTVALDIRWNFGTSRTLTITLPTTLNTPICVALVAYSSTDYRFFCNGQQQNGTLSPGTFGSLDRMFGPGDTINGGVWFTGFGSGVAVSDADMLDITANPEARLWGMFQRRIWVPVTAASGTTGTSATTNAADTSSASGTTTVVGTSARTNANDTSTASGTTTVVGTSATTNAADTSSASGAVGNDVSGTSATTNANDTSSASGTTTVVGTSATTNAADTSTASGTTTVTGTSTTTNANDTATASGAAGSITGTSATTNANDVASASGSGGPVTASTGAGRSKRRQDKRPVVVEIDGEDFVVNSEEEAVALLDKAKEQAEQLAQVQIARAAKAERRKTGKVIADARKTLVVPQIKAPGLESYAAQVLADIRDTYASTMRTIEVAALLRKRDREEEDDEDVLLLLL